MRIDKILSNLGFGSRKEIHQMLKDRLITVNGEIIRKKDFKLNLENDEIKINGKLVDTRIGRYIKFNKPAGYITAVEDQSAQTIMELLPDNFKKMKVFPVGRLDKDTEGLILLTNDGKWAHKIINGNKDIEKVYHFTYNGVISEEGQKRIAEGMVLGDGSICKPAKLEILSDSEAVLTISEGKYHQVKRMIGACDAQVDKLKRIKIAELNLDGVEEPGQYADLTVEELSEIEERI